MNLKSKLQLLKIKIERYLDHSWRQITGFPMLKRSAITKDIYLGGQYYLRAINKFKKLGVTGIVNMRLNSIYTEAKLQGLRSLHLPTPDQQAPTLEQLKKGVTFIKKEIENGGKVYIHCRYGEGRGPTMAIAYLISTGVKLDDAIEYVRDIRTFIRPTLVQLERLKEFELMTIV